jgi:hypothetical protein
MIHDVVPIYNAHGDFDRAEDACETMAILQFLSVEIVARRQLFLSQKLTRSIVHTLFFFMFPF